MLAACAKTLDGLIKRKSVCLYFTLKATRKFHLVFLFSDYRISFEAHAHSIAIWGITE